MKLIKLNESHYIIVDESKQPVQGYYYDNFIKDIRDTRGADYGQADHCWQITHSTKSLEYSPKIGKYWNNVQPISLSEVKELIGEVDVEKKATDYANTFIGEGSTADVDYKAGYIAALEDNKDKVYTKEDMIRAYRQGGNNGAAFEAICQNDYNDAKRFEKANDEKFMASLQPPTSWHVTIVYGKLKLK